MFCDYSLAWQRRRGGAKPPQIGLPIDEARRRADSTLAPDDAPGRVDAVAHVADLEGTLPRSAERRQRIEARGAGVGAAERSYDAGELCCFSKRIRANVEAHQGETWAGFDDRRRRRRVAGKIKFGFATGRVAAHSYCGLHGDPTAGQNSRHVRERSETQEVHGA